MRFPRLLPRSIGLPVLGLVALLGGAEIASASVLSPTPTLPVLGVPYLPSTGAGCFIAAGVCIDLGALTMTSVISSNFNPSGQDIVTDAVFTGEITTILGLPLRSISLTGTVEQEVLGRVTSTELGSWTTDLLSLALSGPVQGHTLSVGLDRSNPSSGLTSVVPAGGGQDGFRITSFFDVFVELSLDSIPPLTTGRGPIELDLGRVPEPAGFLILAPALLGLAAVRRRGGTLTPMARAGTDAA